MWRWYIINSAHQFYRSQIYILSDEEEKRLYCDYFVTVAN